MLASQPAENTYDFPQIRRRKHGRPAAGPGEILLCHDGGGDRSQTYAALRTVIPALKSRGYRFVALDHRHP